MTILNTIVKYLPISRLITEITTILNRLDTIIWVRYINNPNTMTRYLNWYTETIIPWISILNNLLPIYTVLLNITDMYRYYITTITIYRLNTL